MSHIEALFSKIISQLRKKRQQARSTTTPQ